MGLSDDVTIPGWTAQPYASDITGETLTIDGGAWLARGRSRFVSWPA
jgi:hypothetical protein